jgi:Tfp pilus assembly protein PilF
MKPMTRTQLKSSIPALVIVLCCCLGGPLWGQEKGDLPITTRSPEALQFYKKGLLDLRAYNFASAQENWRKATELDPDFAMAHLHLAFVPVTPADQALQLQKAIASRNAVSPGEQKLLDWLANAMQGKMIPALQSMNDALAMYPEDNTVAWGAALWLQSRGACDRAVPIYERVLAHDPDFTPAWRGVGECYIRKQDFDQGFAAMKKYVALLPNQPVPEVYYGLALVRADRYEDGIAHCQAALAMNVNNLEAVRCIAMGHALQGDTKRARTEYAKLIASPRVISALTAGLESAATYVQEKDYKGADKAFLETAGKANAAGYSMYEAEAYRSMALYQAESATALDLLKKAESALDEHPLSRLDRDSKRAAILQTRVILALGWRDTEAANAAAAQLQELDQTSHAPAVEHATAGATGAIMATNKKYAEAFDLLEEDRDNPFSLKYLIPVCHKVKQEDAARVAAKRLLQNNSLSVDQVIVLSEMRKQKSQLALK